MLWQLFWTFLEIGAVSFGGGYGMISLVRETVLREGCSIGANATIVCGHTLGEYCMVGAGSVVTRDVPPYALVVGNPARIIGHVCRCGQKLEDGVCPKCHARPPVEE